MSKDDDHRTFGNSGNSGGSESSGGLNTPTQEQLDEFQKGMEELGRRIFGSEFATGSQIRLMGPGGLDVADGEELSEDAKFFQIAAKEERDEADQIFDYLTEAAWMCGGSLSIPLVPSNVVIPEDIHVHLIEESSSTHLLRRIDIVVHRDGECGYGHKEDSQDSGDYRGQG